MPKNLVIVESPSKTKPIEKYTNFLKELDAAQIQACYDWYGLDKDFVVCYGYKIDIVKPSSPTDFVGGKNYVYSLIK